MNKMPKFFGMATMGQRGQVVIPKEARKLLNIKSGDKLIVTSGPHGKKMVNFIPADDFAHTISHFEKHISQLKSELDKRG